MRKTALILLGLFLAGHMVNAQLKFGLKGGLNLAGMTYEYNGEDMFEDHMKQTMGFHAGAMVLLGLPMGLEFETGALLSQKGFKMELEDYDWKVVASPLYIDIPLKLNFKFEIGPATAFVGAGPIISYGIGGKFTYTNDGEEESEDIKWGEGEDDDFKPLDIGLGVQAGLRFAKLQISGFYDLGMANISPEEDYVAKNKVMGVSVAFLF